MKFLYRFIRQTLPRPLLIRLSYVFRVFAPLIYRGNKVECVVCEHHFSSFLSYGYKGRERENVLCPYCLSLERHRLMWYFLKFHTDFFRAEKLKVLHIAPEQCFYKAFKKQKNLEYITGDLYSPLADYKFDLHEIPFPEDTYDVVFCNHVLEHVKDAEKCMKELYRVMKPGGYGIMQVPQDMSREKTYEDSSITDPKEREKAFWQYDHLRLFGRDYPDHLRNAGFDVKEKTFENDLNDDLIGRMRFQKSEILYLASKPS